MQSKKMSVPILLLLVLGLAQFGFGQLASPRPSHRTLGYLNPITGAFEPLRSEMDASEAPVVAPTTGTLVFKFKISVKSAIPNNSIISCIGTASVFDVSSGAGFTEEATGVATGSGTAFTCTATIHYSWLLASAASDKVNLDTSTSMEYGFQVTASNGSAILVVPAVARQSAQPQAAIAVPLNGATTTENISVTL